MDVGNHIRHSIGSLFDNLIPDINDNISVILKYELARVLSYDANIKLKTVIDAYRE
jgi:hypothetical protein